jgi:NADPH:quinone reductase-like Zn-dependent oxidoreductase
VRQGTREYELAVVCASRVWFTDGVCDGPIYSTVEALETVRLTYLSGRSSRSRPQPDLETPKPLSAGAVLNNLKPAPDSSIAIYGCGAVGMSAILAAAYLGVKTIIAVDIIPQRLTLAKEFGATHVVSGKSPTCVQDVRDITPYGAGTQYAVEASGNAKVLRVAYDALGSFGHLTSCGTPGPGVPAPMGIHEHVTSGKIYSGTLMGNDDPNNVSNAQALRPLRSQSTPSVSI